MPIYEFRCEDCGRLFETLCFTVESERDVKCPYCNSKRVKKEFSRFATSWGSSFGIGGSSCGGSGGRGFGFG